ncbi:MAG: hypothetical protein B193_3545, partial [Solidesulfovibrio magneticus str. Maddingley MBC34]
MLSKDALRRQRADNAPSPEIPPAEAASPPFPPFRGSGGLSPP